MSKLKRETNETQIAVDMRIGSGATNVVVDDTFLGHMVVTLGRYSGVDIDLTAKGDLRHHLVEDVAIVLGSGLASEVPERATRYGWHKCPWTRPSWKPPSTWVDDRTTWASCPRGCTPTFSTPSRPI